MPKRDTLDTLSSSLREVLGFFCATQQQKLTGKSIEGFQRGISIAIHSDICIVAKKGGT